MEAALLKRTRAAAGVIAVAGVFNAEPAIDFDERKSDAESAFPAAIQSLVSPGKQYDQDGPDGTRTSLVRWECFGLTSDDAFALAQAIVAANEPSGMASSDLAFSQDITPSAGESSVGQTWVKPSTGELFIRVGGGILLGGTVIVLGGFRPSIYWTEAAYDVRFGRGFLKFERNFPPETVGELKIYRRIVDMEITATF